MSSFLGQNFLKNPAISAKIVGELEKITNQTIIEIGPGRGALTRLLSAQAQKNGNSIVAIEKDKRLALSLYKEVLPSVTVEHGDIRDMLPEVSNTLKNNGQKYSIIGNIPYYLTGFLLRIISELPQKPEITVLMVQKEVGERLTAQPPHMNKLAASVQVWSTAEKICFVSKKDFSPEPKVDSVVVKMIKKEDFNPQNTEKYYELVKILFAQPRKTIENNLKAGLKQKNSKITSADIEKVLEKEGIAPNLRPQDLTIDQIIALSSIL